MKNVLLFIGIVLAIVFIMATASANPSPEKWDGGCTGGETVGRCADKCANPDDRLIGHEADTGIAICEAQAQPTVEPAPQPTPLNIEGK